jgi:acetylornithine deacetylase/succinyl-diaminopimelate desuccinylase-like protein
VLPSEARVKIDFRLVPDMEPQHVLGQLRAHLDANGYSDIEIIDLGGEHPARSDLDTDIVRAAVTSAEQTFGMPVVVSPLMAGSGPMYVIGQAQGTPVATGAGCGYHGSRIHSPNENIRLEDYWMAMRWMGLFVRAFAG